MKSVWQRLWWAVVGYRTTPWPVLPPPPRVLTQTELETVFDNRAPGGILSPYQHERLRGSIKLAADLLAPHFQSAISAVSLGAFGPAEWQYTEPVGTRRFVHRFEEWNALTEYRPAATDKEEMDLLLSGAAWLAKHADVSEDEFQRLALVAKNDIYHPEP